MTQANPGPAYYRLLIAAILSSAASSVCCLGPFILLATGFSGAWMSTMMRIEPLQPLLIAISVALVLLAGYQLIVNPSCSNAFRDSVIGTVSIQQVLVYFTMVAVILVLLASEYWIPFIIG